MLYLFLFILGSSIGSFLNVLIDRLPKEESIMGRSHCDHCKHKLDPMDLIPIVSYILLRGRCRQCKKKISVIYPIVELLTGVVFILSWLFNPNIIYLGIISCLLVIFFADAKYRIIPDSIQIALFLLSLALLIYNGVKPEVFAGRILSAFLVMLPILFLYLVTKGRGMGFGDVKLAFIMGFTLGTKYGFLSLYIGFVVGALFGVLMILTKRKSLKSKIAFGPFIIIGLVAMLFWGNLISAFVDKWFKV